MFGMHQVLVEDRPDSFHYRLVAGNLIAHHLAAFVRTFLQICKSFIEAPQVFKFLCQRETDRDFTPVR